MGDKGKIVEEHFWFTATTVGVNGFIMSSRIDPIHLGIVKVFSTIISIYAIFLIVHRSAAHAGKIKYPQDLREIPESEKSFIHKARETWHHLRIFPKHFLYVIFELSGALFYTLLVVLSCIGVWISK